MARRVLLFGVVLAAALSVAELTLRAMAPVSLSTIGHTSAANARYYGWGYDPGDLIRLRDPDTGEAFVDRANNHGWRDIDRTVENPRGALRIVALGDSNTFGMIVAAADTWTQQLERLLREEGIDAEVVNLSYAGWGTDQELEALRQEGLAYAPDIVVLQFTINDLTDNRSVSPFAAAMKPFHYTLDPEGRPLRHEGPLDPDAMSRGTHGALKKLASRFEITKRIYIALEGLRHSASGRYSATELQRTQLRTVLGLADNDCLLTELADIADESFDENDVSAVLQHCGRASDRAVVLMILESQPFKDQWSPLQYDPWPLDENNDEWRLFHGLLREIAAAVRSVGASLVVLSDQEEGFYEWERAWYRIGPGDAVHAKFLAPNDVLKRYAQELDAGFVAPLEKHERARNDSHPNRSGSLAMAQNVLAHLKSEHAAVLEAHRTR